MTDLVRITAVSEVSRFTLRADMVAHSNHRSLRSERFDFSEYLLGLSAVGSDTAVKAVRAMLYEPKVAVEFRLRTLGEDAFTKIKRVKAPYKCSVARLAPGCVHLVAMADVEGLVVDTSESALWHELRKPRLTTPLCREWVPYIRGQLDKANALIECEGHNTTFGLMVRVNTPNLDDLVSSAMRTGEITIPEMGA